MTGGWTPGPTKEAPRRTRPPGRGLTLEPAGEVWGPSTGRERVGQEASALEAIGEAGSVNPDLKVLLAAVEASVEAILVTSADLEGGGLRIEYVNPAFTRMTGYEATKS